MQLSGRLGLSEPKPQPRNPLRLLAFQGPCPPASPAGKGPILGFSPRSGDMQYDPPQAFYDFKRGSRKGPKVT